MSILSEVAEEGIISNFAVLLANGWTQVWGESKSAEDEDAIVDDDADEEEHKTDGVGISVDTFSNIVGFFFPESRFLPGPADIMFRPTKGWFFFFEIKFSRGLRKSNVDYNNAWEIMLTCNLITCRWPACYIWCPRKSLIPRSFENSLNQMLSYCCNLLPCLLSVNSNNGVVPDVSLSLLYLFLLSRLKFSMRFKWNPPTSCRQFIETSSLRILHCCVWIYFFLVKTGGLVYLISSQSIDSLETLMMDYDNLTGDNAL